MAPPKKDAPKPPALVLAGPLPASPFAAPVAHPARPDLFLRASAPLVEVIPSDGNGPTVVSDLPDRVRAADAALRERHQKALLRPYSVSRDSGGQFVHGAVGNPQGRPPSFVRYIKTMTRGGTELVDHAMLALRGSVVVRWQDEASGHMLEKIVPADPKTQGDARAFLAAQGHLADEPEEKGHEDSLDLSALSIDELRAYLQLQDKVERAPRALPAVTDGGSDE